MKPPLKILIIGYEFVPLLGGAAAYTRELAVGLSRNGVQVHVLTCYHGKITQNMELDAQLKEQYGISIRRFRPRGKIFYFQLWYHVIKLYGFQFAQNFHWIIMADARAVRFSMVFLPKKIWPKCLNIFHGGQINKIMLNPSFWIRLLRINKQFKSYLFRSLGGITVSSFQRKQFLTLDKRLASKIHTVYHGVDEEIFKPLSRRERLNVRRQYELGHDEVVIISSSRLTAEKGQDYLLKAFAGIQDKYPNVKIVLAGGGDYAAGLKRMAKELGVESRVLFTGQMAREKLALLTAACDFAVMLSRIPFEAFGLVSLEANACGLPVLAGNQAGVPEAVEEGISGILVNPEDISAIQQGLELLLRNKKYEQLGKTALDRVLRDYTCAIMSKNTLKILQRGAYETKPTK